MEDLNTQVKDLQGKLKEKYGELRDYRKKQDALISRQIDVIKETASTLLPVMEIIRREQFRFTGKDTNYYSNRGPILKEDKRKNLLYVFSVESKIPQTVNLYNDEVKNISYLKLIQEVEFETIMDNLLYVLTYHEEIKLDYQKSISELEKEIKEYESLF